MEKWWCFFFYWYLIIRVRGESQQVLCLLWLCLSEVLFSISTWKGTIAAGHARFGIVIRIMIDLICFSCICFSSSLLLLYICFLLLCVTYVNIAINIYGMYIRCLETRTRTLCTIFKMEFSTEYWKSCCKLKRNSNDLDEEGSEPIKRNCWHLSCSGRRKNCRSAWQKCQCECQEQKQKPRRPNQNVWNAFTKYGQISPSLSLSVCGCRTCGMPACACVRGRVCVRLCVCTWKAFNIALSRQEDKIVRDKCQRLWC